MIMQADQDHVTEFGWQYKLPSACITYNSKLALLLLIRNSTQPNGAGISMEYIGCLRIGKTQHRSSGKLLNNQLKCLLASGCPVDPKRLLWIVVLPCFLFRFGSFVGSSPKIQVMLCKHITHLVELLSDAVLPLRWNWGLTEVETQSGLLGWLSLWWIDYTVLP
ncbi:unnamed protein product [Merluccius merluccius]